MALLDLFTPVSKRVQLWDSQARQAVLDSLQAAQRASAIDDRNKWSKLRSFLDGVHSAETQAAAAISHPQDSIEWASGDGHAYRYFRLVEMIAERLSVIFHTPPELYLHTGDGEPLTADDPTYGDQVQQWEEDKEFSGLDTLLPYIDAAVNVLGQQVVSPSWVSDGDIQGIKWVSCDPHEVYVHQSDALPGEIAAAKSVSIEVRQPVDSIGGQSPSLWSTWTREVTGGDTAYGHWFHDSAGSLFEDRLFGVQGQNPYGVIPAVLWQSRKPSNGTIFLPPDEALIQDQLGISINLTDLAWGLRYAIHPTLVGKGERPEGVIKLGLGNVLWMQDEEADLDSLTLDLQAEQSLSVIEWMLRATAVSRSLPPDMLNPSAARNLAALQEQRHDLMIRRERVKPHYLRALKNTWHIHRVVGNYWASQGVRRVRYASELELGVTLAPIPRVEDRWQSAQARQLEVAQGIASVVDEVARREGVSRDEAERIVQRNLDERKEYAAETQIEPTAEAVLEDPNANPAQDNPNTPRPAKAPGEQRRPASTERS